MWKKTFEHKSVVNVKITTCKINISQMYKGIYTVGQDLIKCFKLSTKSILEYTIKAEEIPN